jgi:predicted RNA-binding Zn ribbon-like protein
MKVSFPSDWLDPHAPGVATDLDLALLLVNTLDNLEPEPDRLQDLNWFRAALRQIGHAELASQLRESDLGGLRRLRDNLRAVFEADQEQTVVDALNPLLERADAVALLTRGDLGLRLAVGVGRRGLDAVEVRLPAAVATYVVERGYGRLGTCAAEPCSCAFVDRTRAGTRRYCCSYCNDRAAARAYRRRKSAER